MRWSIVLITSFISLTLFFALALVVQTDAQGVATEHHKVAPELQDAMADADGALIPILIEFADAANLQTRLPSDPILRRADIVARLQSTAEASQAGVVAQLSRRGAGEVRGLQTLWIVNQLAVWVSAETIPQLTTDINVTQIRLDNPHQYIDPDTAFDHDSTGHNRDYPDGAWGVEHINAPDVWNHFNISGTGSVVAIMDTGADWQHPALRDNYRGRDGNHATNWFSAVDISQTIPLDEHGHGTHVAGTAVGHNGIGVAPGAEWIAVQILNADGIGYESDIHAGFQWLLAPNGDPANAPDIVNNSWGSSLAAPTFYEDVQALQAAGIIPVFAAGNTGPSEGTMGYPAGYTDTLSVGAYDHRSEIAWFSSRGPSALTSQPKPALSAPGTRTYSSLPNGEYGLFNGTSMAAPHVAGVIALLKSAEPTLTESQITNILTTTTQTTHLYNLPNSVNGWGHLDAYAALFPYADAHHKLFLPFIAQQNRVTSSYTLRGNVQDSEGNGIVATVSAKGAGISTTTNVAGSFALTLPKDDYLIVVNAIGWRDQTTTIAMTGNRSQNFTLSPVPSILLVDGSGWRYRSELDFYRDTLDELAHDFDEHSIMNPLIDVPTFDYLNQYETVIWSDIDRSPGYIYAGEVISQYLDAGGNLLISGQSVGSIDSDGFDTQNWWWNHLRGRGVQAGSPERLVSSDDSAEPSASSVPQFANLAFDLNGGDSADNQTQLEHASWQQFSLTAPLLETADGNVAALAAGLCRPYKLIYFGFGLEGVQTATDRATLLDSTLDYFAEPAASHDLRLLTEPIDTFVVPGSSISYTLRVANVSETLTETITMQTNSAWPVTIEPATFELGACRATEVTVTVDVPLDVAFDTVYAESVSAETTHTNISLPMLHRTPGDILFVDDDRWYNYEDRYLTELNRLGIPYDYWDVGWNGAGRGSISAELLNQYDIVMWYTGADWFQPLTTTEAKDLSSFMENGGRLFLTGQSILTYHEEGLIRPYLGVLKWQDELTMTKVFGEHRGALPSDLGGAHTLNYSQFNRYSDGLVPSDRAVSWSDGGQAAGVATRGVSTNNIPWRSVFWGVPPEILTDTAAAEVVNQSLGWLSDLGESTIEVDQRSSATGATRAYTITVRNLPEAPLNAVTVTNSLSVSLTIDPATLVGATYDATMHQVRWQGDVTSGGEHQIYYEATVAGSGQIDNDVTFEYARHRLRFERKASVWIDAPDVTDSGISAEFTILGEPITYTFQLTNTGPSGILSVTLYLPDDLGVLTDTLSANSGTALLYNHDLHWEETVTSGSAISFSIAMTSPLAVEPLPFYAVAKIEDGISAPVVHDLIIEIPVIDSHLPSILGNE